MAASAADIDSDALKLAQAFMVKLKPIARLMHTRTLLETLYTETWEAWAPSNKDGNFEYDADDVAFSKVLYAMAHGMKVLTVRHQREINWR